MNYMTTTDLRTRSSQLIDLLGKGVDISLIHRSQIVAIIKPKRKPKALTQADIEKIKKLAIKVNLPKISYADREKIYRKYLFDKYGKNLSRH